MKDNHKLQRFLSAQDNKINTALQELKQGRKKSHWMWFIFPQIRGLGFSPTARYYAIQSKAEALAYLQHPILGARLRECTETVNVHQNLSAKRIFGYPDYLKFRSCMTLFDVIAEEDNPFTQALEIFFSGKADTKTLDRLKVID